MISFVKLGTISYIITNLNSFGNNIQFTFEEEHKGTLPFLDVLIRRKGNSILTTVFRKHIYNDIYLNLNAFAPDTWKRETLKTIVERAYIVCSTNELLQMELKYLEKVFHETNNYPQHIIKQILKQVQDEQNQQNVTVPIAATADETKTNGKKEHLLLVPYQGKKGDYVIKSMKKRMKSLLSTGCVAKSSYVGNKLSTCFCVKDVTEFKHNHDIIYQSRCPEIRCNDHYLAETGHRISERVLDHAGRDPNSHLFKHSVEFGHPVLDKNNYKIIEKGYRNNVRKRKIAEVLLIKRNETHTK